MRNLLVLVAVGLIVAGCSGMRHRAGGSFVLKVPSAGNLPAHRFTHVATKTNVYNYLLHLPKDYHRQSDQKWPLILFLHGAGERGDDVSRVTVHGPPKLLTPGAKLSAAESAAARLLAEKFIVVSPQCPANTRWDNDTLLALLDRFIEKTQRVDTNRVYLTGLSMGGYGTWSLGLRNPHRFAAIAPICGGGERIDILIGSRAYKTELQGLPVWAFHGAKDTAVPLSESERMVEALKKAGVKDAQLKVYPEAPHDSWTETYANPKLYEWFLQHRRE
jgi:predicted peptidase